MGPQFNLRELLAQVPTADTAQLLKSYFLEHDPDPQLRSALEPLQTPEEIVRFFREQRKQLQNEYQGAEEGRLSALTAKRMFESAATEVNDLRNASVQQFRDFALYLGRYLNDEMDIPPEVPEELGPFGESLLAGIEELREQARRPAGEDTEKVVFMEGDTTLDTILDIISHSVESDDPEKYFLGHISRLSTLPEGYDRRLIGLGAFFHTYGTIRAELDHAQETTGRQRQTLETAAADLEELHGLRGRLPELEEQADKWQRRLTETEGYWEAETRARIAADGEAKSARMLLAENGGELELLREQVRDFEELQRDQAGERADLESGYRTLERQLQEAAERSRQQEVELQTEIAITRADRDRFKDYFHRQIQRVLQFVQELRTQRGRERELQKAVDEERGRYQELEKKLQQATGDLRQREREIVGFTGNLEKRTEEYQTEQRQRRLAEGQAKELERKLRSVTTEREAARGALQGQLDEVHRLEAVQGYNERLKQFLRRGAQRLRESTKNLRAERRLSAGLQERMEELIRGGEAKSHPYDAVVAQRDEAQGQAVNLTLQVEEYNERLASAQRLRAVAEGELNDLHDRYDERGLHLEASRGRVRELSDTYRKLSARLHTQRQVSSTAIDRISTLHARLEEHAANLRQANRLGMEVLDRTVKQYEQSMAEQDLANALEEGIREELEERLRRAESAYDAFSQFVAEPLEHAVQVVERVNTSLRGRREGDTAVRKSIARQLRKRERQVAQLSRQLDRLDVEYTVLNVEQEQLAAHYEEEMQGCGGLNRDLEQSLEHVTAQLGDATTELAKYRTGMSGARTLTERLVTAAAQPLPEHRPLFVESSGEPDEVSPAVTEPVLDAMIESVESVTPPEQTSVRTTKTYYPKNILRAVAIVGAAAGVLAAGWGITSYLRHAWTSPAVVEQVTAPVQIPIQNAADLLRYKSALESAYLEGIHHREGRDAILQRLQETAQRHPLQNDALKLDYEGQLTNMRRIVGITHK